MTSKKRLCTICTMTLLILSHQGMAEEDDYGVSLVPDALQPFYKHFILEYHYHEGTPTVFAATCWEKKHNLCVIYWSEPLRSNTDDYISYVRPYAKEYVAQTRLEEGEYWDAALISNEQVMLDYYQQHFNY